MDREPKKRINISIAPSTHKKGKALAKADQRPFSNMVENLIEAEALRVKLPVRTEEEEAKAA